MSGKPMPPIIIDTREQQPYTFKGAVRQALKSGDYSLLGFETRVSVERKSMPDLFQSLGKGRARFEKEFKRLAGFDYAALVVECTIEDLKENPPRHGALPGATVFKSVISWSIRYGVHVFFAGSRRYARAVTYEILRKYWYNENRGKINKKGKP